MTTKNLVMETILIIAKISVFSGLIAALLLAVDLWRHPQQMPIMNAVWILTGLWAGVLALAAYAYFGRNITKKSTPQSPKIPTTGMSHEMPMNGMKMSHDMQMPMDGMKMSSGRPMWQSVVVSTLHCGAGCTAADIIGEWFLFFVPVAIGGSLVVGGWALDYVLALVLGIAFQYFAIRGMGGVSRGGAVVRAAKADVLSLTAWQVGMYGWMGVVIFVLWGGVGLSRASFEFWFMMQVAMGFGFVLALPMNVLLIKWGIKKPM